MEFALPTDSTEASGLSLLQRLWVARFDVEEEGRALAEQYVLCSSLSHESHSLKPPAELTSCLVPRPDSGSLWAWSWSRSSAPC